ncbi:MAG: hypothetical protein WDO18_23255 [Acidobacteriota bacterium]
MRVYGAAVEETEDTHREVEEGERLTPLTILFWLALAATASTLLLATTNLITQDIAVAPFLWILPLSVYLLSFILTFESDRWYWRLPYAVACGVLAPVAAATTGAGTLLPLWGEAGVYVVALFAACMVCHGELAKARPGARHLTAFYLTVSAGGVVGGVFVALIAPTVVSRVHGVSFVVDGGLWVGDRGVVSNGRVGGVDEAKFRRAHSAHGAVVRRPGGDFTGVGGRHGE